MNDSLAPDKNIEKNKDDKKGAQVLVSKSRASMAFHYLISKSRHLLPPGNIEVAPEEVSH